MKMSQQLTSKAGLKIESLVMENKPLLEEG